MFLVVVMVFLRGSTDSQWSSLYLHLLLASDVRQSIVEDTAIRSKLFAWRLGASQGQWDDTHRYTLSSTRV